MWTGLLIVEMIIIAIMALKTNQARKDASVKQLEVHQWTEYEERHRPGAYVPKNIEVRSRRWLVIAVADLVLSLLFAVINWLPFVMIMIIASAFMIMVMYVNLIQYSTQRTDYENSQHARNREIIENKIPYEGLPPR